MRSLRSRVAPCIALACLAVTSQVVFAPRAAADDFESRRARSAQRALDEAIASAEEAYCSRVVEAQRGYRRALQRVQRDIMRAGELEEARRIEQVLAWLERAEAGARPGTLRREDVEDSHELGSAAAQAAQRDYRTVVATAQEEQTGARRAALEEYVRELEQALAVVMRASDLPEAERIDAALRRSRARLESLRASVDWVVLFRSRHPEDWDTSAQEEDRFATPLDAAPEATRFVRLRRMDTEEYVVLAVAREALGQDATGDGTYLWCGGRVAAQGGVHLGIDSANWSLTYRDGGRIIISNARSTAGWGFGHKVHANDAQYWSWAGQEIPPVTFEIAVTARELTPEEREHLLESASRD